MRQFRTQDFLFRSQPSRSFFAAVSVSLLIACAPVAIAKEKAISSGNSDNPSATDWRTPYVEGERKLKTQELEAAEAAFAEALRRVKNNRKSTPDDLSLCYQSLASAHYMKDRFYELVIPLYKKAISTLEKAYGKQSPKLVSPLAAYAAVREDEGDYKAAAKLLTRARTIIEKSDGKSSLVYADNLHRLGRINSKLDLPRKAEEMYFESLTVVMQQKVLPSSDAVEQQVSDYIDLLTKSENQGKAFNSAFQKELLKDSVSSFERTQGVSTSKFNKEVSGRLAPEVSTASERILPDDQTSGWSQNSSSASATGSFSSAISPDKPMTDFAALEEINKQRVAFYERMISTDILSLGPEHPSVARDLSGLASFYLSQKKYEEAKPLLLKALAIYEKSYTSESNMIKKTQELLQLVEEQQHPHPELNVARIGDYLTRLPAIPLAAQKLEVALRLNKLAFLNYCQGKLPQAERIYSWAVASTARAAGEQSLLTASSLIDYSRVLRSTGKQSDAETMDSSAQSILRRAISQNAMRY